MTTGFQFEISEACRKRMPCTDPKSRDSADPLVADPTPLRRRDLTIGALLLRVQRAPGERGESNGLEFEVFDFYGGVDDLCKGVLRSPCPVNKSVAEVAEEIVYNYFSQESEDYALVTRKEKSFDPGQWLSELLPWSAGELKARDALDEVLPQWRSLELGPQTEQQLRRRFRALTTAAGGEEAALTAMRKNIAVMYFGEDRAKHLKIQELPPDEAVQVLWWSKVLIDDPLRICRALRFAAKFKFELHKAFWLAVPFALEPRSQSSFVSRIMLTSSYKAMLSNLVPIPFCYSVTE
eukprot:g3278.t1